MDKEIDKVSENTEVNEKTKMQALSFGKGMCN